MNKKAVTGDQLIYVFRLIGSFIALAIVIAIIQSSIKSRLDLDDMRFFPIAQRALYSPNCFVHVDSNRVYPGIIDAEKFTQENLDSCMAALRRSIGARFTLSYDDNNEVVYYNRVTFEDVLPLTFSNLYKLVRKRYFVLVKKDDELMPGNLLVEVDYRK